MSQNFLLHVYYEDIFKEFDIAKYNKNNISVGKASICDISINFDNINEKEVILKKENGNWILLDQTNKGVRCNITGKLLNRKELKKNDILIIGNNILTLVVKDAQDFNGISNMYDIESVSSIRIGRDVDNDIVLKDSAVSSEHAKIFKDSDNEFYIHDCKSQNGIHVNGSKYKKSLLKPGDIIHICGHKIIFEKKSIIVSNVGRIVNVKNLKLIRGQTGNKKIEYPIFMRSPRIMLEFPQGEVCIENPPTKQNMPQIQWFPIIFPPLAMAIPTIMFSVMRNASVTRQLTSFEKWSPYMFLFGGVGSIAIALYNYANQKKQFKRAEEVRKVKYTSYIEGIRHELEEKAELQKRSSFDIHADINTCIERAKNRERKLWERTPRHNDFLLLRAGIGNDKFRVELKNQKQDIFGDEDELKNKPQEILNEFGVLKDLPVCIPLAQAGTSGVIGDREDCIEMARALAVQIATHHSYEEVKVVAIYPSDESSKWDFIKWLPHTWDSERQLRMVANEKESAHNILSKVHDFLKQREAKFNSKDRQNSADDLAIPHFVFFLADRELLENEPIMTYLACDSHELGISTIYLYDSLENLPKECNYIIELMAKKGSIVNKNIEGSSLTFVPDRLSAERADYFSRSLASLRVKQLLTIGNLPDSISMLDMFHAKTVEDLHIIVRWKNSETYKSLAAPLGIRLGGEKLLLDLHEKSHGPHGLVAGTTGSGKSELLQSFIISMAINYHPHDVAFVLIDYKGGGMANAFANLPHLLGRITNLDGNETKRALSCIESENKRRQAKFKEYNVTHIDDYQRLYREGKAESPMPHLIIIADEFAELKSEQPEFMDKLVSLARVGRSLGVHLILATQKPSGVVNDQIWSNSRFRICLKVQEPADSHEVIKRNDAADIRKPGRAYIQIGNNEMFELFQSAWSGADYDPNTNDDNGVIEVKEVELDGRRRRLNGNDRTKKENVKSQLMTLVNYIREVADSNEIYKLNDICPPPLPKKLFLYELFGEERFNWSVDGYRPYEKWLSPVVGLLDIPSMQMQEPYGVDFDDSHLVVYGGPGSGKTTFLQTLLTSTVLTYTPEDVNIYIIDYGNRTLGLFSALPHVGEVLTRDDDLKLSKLIRMMMKEIETRTKLFASKGGTFSSYREACGNSVPAIMLVVDNYPALIENYDYNNEFLTILRDGGACGIHVILTSGSINGVRMKLMETVKSVICLQMVDKSDYAAVVGRLNGRELAPVPGRGFIKANSPLDLQTAIAYFPEQEVDSEEIGSGDVSYEVDFEINELKKNKDLTELFESIKSTWTGNVAKCIPLMPENVYLKDVLSVAKGSKLRNSVSVGLDYENLELVNIDIENITSFMVCGMVQTGKTMFLKSFAKYISSTYGVDKAEIYLVDSEAMGLFSVRGLPNVKAYVTEKSEMDAVMADWKNTLKERKTALVAGLKNSPKNSNSIDILSRYARRFLIVDDLNTLIKMIGIEDKSFIEDIIRRERKVGLHIIVSGLTSDYNALTFSDSIVKAYKELQVGFVIGNPSDTGILKAGISGTYMSREHVKGDGYFIREGKVTPLRVANSDGFEVEG